MPTIVALATVSCHRRRKGCWTRRTGLEKFLIAVVMFIVVAALCSVGGYYLYAYFKKKAGGTATQAVTQAAKQTVTQTVKQKVTKEVTKEVTKTTTKAKL